MAISDSLYIDIMNRMAEAIVEHPEQMEKIRKDFLDRVHESIRKKQQDVIITMLTNLYCFDYNALKADAARIILLKGERDATRKERADLLRALWGTLGVYFNGDYAFLMNECERVIEYHESCGEGGMDVEELPFL